MRYKELKKKLDSDLWDRLVKVTKGYGATRDFANLHGLDAAMIAQVLYWRKATPTNIEKIKSALEKDGAGK